MARPFTPKVVTANALLAGDAIWFTADQQWSPALADAAVYDTQDDADAALTLAAADQAHIAGAYLADVQNGQQGPQPVHFRETFRTRGPSNYAHGKQEAK